jgi:hypothetical protein
MPRVLEKADAALAEAAAFLRSELQGPVP